MTASIEQEHASLGAFIDRAGRDGFDTAHTFFACGEVVFFNSDTADLWGFWQAARRALEEPVPQGWKLVPVDLLERIQESLSSFVSDQGWSQSDMDTADALAGLLAAA